MSSYASVSEKQSTGAGSRLDREIRLSEVLGALSLTTDLGAGVPFEKGLRTCVVASRLADTLGLARADRQAVYFAALLRSLGCTAHASVFAEMFENDVAVQRELKTLDPEDPDALAAQTARFATWAGTERAKQLTAKLLGGLSVQGAALGRGSCEVSAERLSASHPGGRRFESGFGMPRRRSSRRCASSRLVLSASLRRS